MGSKYLIHFTYIANEVIELRLAAETHVIDERLSLLLLSALSHGTLDEVLSLAEEELFFFLLLFLNANSVCSRCIRLDTVLFHPIEELVGDFPQRLPGQILRIIFELVEWHKLHDVCLGILSA